MARRGLKAREMANTRPKKYQGAQRLIKMFNTQSAKSLVKKGFPYFVERVGSGIDLKEIYAFPESEELNEYIMSNYSEQDYYYDIRLNF